MSKKTLILSSLVLVLLGFFFLLELFLPELVAGKIREEIEKSFRGEITLQKVEVKSKPAVKLLLGKADSIALEASGLSLGELKAEKLELVLQEVEINFLQREKQQGSVLDQAKALTGTMLISEAALNQFFSREGFLPIKNPQIDIQEDSLLLRGITKVLNNPVEVEVSGVFKVTPGNTLVFQPLDLEVAGFRVPAFLKESLLKQIAFSMNLKNIPFDLKLRELKLNKDKVTIDIEK